MYRILLQIGDHSSAWGSGPLGHLFHTRAAADHICESLHAEISRNIEKWGREYIQDASDCNLISAAEVDEVSEDVARECGAI